MSVDGLSEFLETYSGRDKVLRMMYYAAQMVAGTTKNGQLREKLNLYSEQIDSCRIVLRLLDDIPMLSYTRSYGLGKQGSWNFWNWKFLFPVEVHVLIHEDVNAPLAILREESDRINLDFRMPNNQRFPHVSDKIAVPVPNKICREPSSTLTISVPKKLAIPDKKSLQTGNKLFRWEVGDFAAEIIDLRRQSDDLYSDVGAILSGNGYFSQGSTIQSEPDKVLQTFGVAANVIDQLYYPLEHVAWAADHKLIEVNSEPWWMASNVCWALSSYLMALKSFRYFFLLRNSRRFAGRSQMETRLIRALTRFEHNEFLTAVRCLLDFIHAIHWMPSGVLWSGKLKQWQIGSLGFVSSLISLYQSNFDLSLVKVL